MAKNSEMQYLHRCVELAREALEAGDNPFGSVLVAADGEVLFEDRNRVGLVIELGIPSSRLRGGRRRT